LGCITIISAFCWVSARAAVGTDVAVRLEVGRDSNPLRLSGDAHAGAFTQLRLDVGLHGSPVTSWEWFLDAAGHQRLHAGELADANDTFGELRGGWAYVPRAPGLERFSIAVGGLWAAERSTYVDRTTGEVYRVTIDEQEEIPASSVAVPDRFDVDTLGGFIDARYRVSRALRLSLDAAQERAEFTRNYFTTTGLSPLDHDLMRIEPAIALELGRKVSARASLVWSDLDYARYEALDDEGELVPETTRRYRTLQYRIAVAARPTSEWRLRLAWTTADREDAYAGYYDSTTSSAVADLSRNLGQRASIQAAVTLRALDYDRAGGTDVSEEDFAGNRLRRLAVRYERILDRSLRWFAEGGRQDVDSRDASFAYDRDWVLTGIEFRRRTGD
jgi:hypothetical protein